jgi:predicted nucleic acid-binding protein
MNKVDFNDECFSGFEDNEDVLLDTSVILAFLNRYDSWHETVAKLFEEYIIESVNTVFLYVNPTLINEVTYLSGKPIMQYARANDLNVAANDVLQSKRATVKDLRKLIEDEIVIILEGNKESVLKQIDIHERVGDADAVYVSLANEYGISFLTVDNKLVNNLFAISDELKQIRNVYYTNSSHREY